MQKQHIIHNDAVLTADMKSSNWSPNRVFTGTHEEFIEHIRNIETGEFMSLEEFEKEHTAWKMEFLKSQSI